MGDSLLLGDGEDGGFLLRDELFLVGVDGFLLLGVLGFSVGVALSCSFHPPEADAERCTAGETSRVLSCWQNYVIKLTTTAATTTTTTTTTATAAVTMLMMIMTMTYTMTMMIILMMVCFHIVHI